MGTPCSRHATARNLNCRSPGAQAGALGLVAAFRAGRRPPTDAHAPCRGVVPQPDREYQHQRHGAHHRQTISSSVVSSSFGDRFRGQPVCRGYRRPGAPWRCGDLSCHAGVTRGSGRLGRLRGAADRGRSAAGPAGSPRACATGASRSTSRRMASTACTRPEPTGTTSWCSNRDLPASAPATKVCTALTAGDGGARILMLTAAGEAARPGRRPDSGRRRLPCPSRSSSTSSCCGSGRLGAPRQQRNRGSSQRAGLTFDNTAPARVVTPRRPVHPADQPRSWRCWRS